MDTKATIRGLLDKYRHNDCTPEERLLLQEYLRSNVHRSDVEAVLGESLLENIPLAFVNDPKVQETLRRVYGRLPMDDSEVPERRNKLVWWKKPVSIAAMVVVLFSVGLFWYSRHGRDAHEEAIQEGTLADGGIQPGGNRAMLMLADGRTVDLSPGQSGIIVGNGITYTDGSAVLSQEDRKPESPEYNMSGTANGNRNTQYAILTTPKGGTYQITLPDGTKVWLNSASVLKYPSRFDSKERVVELEGEAYFEVSEQVSRLTSEQVRSLTGSRKVAFKVVSAGQVVTVLGTHFNIAAYPDDPEIRTTLVEGAVEVLNKKSQLVNRLKPGKQSIVRHEETTVREADIAGVTGWKRGVFVFEDTELREAMRQLGRWYNVDVEYQGNVPTTHFFGEISREKTLAQVLNILRKSNVKFRFDKTANKLIVYPKNDR